MIRLLHGDCLDVLDSLDKNSVDAIVTDPPYEIAFMEKWDSTGIAFNVELWKKALIVLKPGGHILVFSSARTYHRVTCAIEDAGFQIRDQIMWVYGQGFPKSMSVGDGLGTALKPAHEPIVLARKPLEGTVENNLSKWGVGALNIDISRVPSEPIPINKLENWSGFGEVKRPDYTQEMNTKGRYPANLIHDGSDEVVELFPRAKGGAFPAKRGDASLGTFASGQETEGGYRAMGDDGSAARFFYCAKANTKERNHGMGEEKNTHPTVKPTELMRYLVRLITPNKGVVLDPFMGSGTTAVVSQKLNRKWLGSELSPNYCELIQKRIDEVQGGLF